MKFDLYTEITNQITAMLDKGVVPWRSPILGRGTAGHPKNLNTGKNYRGVNIFLLAFTAYAKGYESAYWLTYKQSQERGGQVRRGEKSQMVIFWKELHGTDEQGQPKKYPCMRFYNVFNACQIDGIAIPDKVAYTPIEFRPIEAAEAIIQRYPNPPTISRGGSRAFYCPSTDSITLPEPERFASIEEQYSTLLHECVHSTGHSKRLDRKLDTDPKPFGSQDYSHEELTAEIGASFLCAHAGIAPAVIENQAAYIQGWLKVLKADKKAIISAASKGQKAADWILGQNWESTETVSSEQLAE